ncbi:hypothetical protein T03_12394, partial [Trichinella britovi]
LDRPPRRPPPSCPLTGTSHVRSLLVPCWPETGFKEMTMSICVCQSSGDRYSPRGTVSVAMLLCYCLAGSGRLHPMIDIRSAVTPFN